MKEKLARRLRCPRLWGAAAAVLVLAGVLLAAAYRAGGPGGSPFSFGTCHAGVLLPPAAHFFRQALPGIFGICHAGGLLASGG